MSTSSGRWPRGRRRRRVRRSTEETSCPSASSSISISARMSGRVLGDQDAGHGAVALVGRYVAGAAPRGVASTSRTSRRHVGALPEDALRRPVQAGVVRRASGPCRSARRPGATRSAGVVANAVEHLEAVGLGHEQIEDDGRRAARGPATSSASAPSRAVRDPESGGLRARARGGPACRRRRPRSSTAAPPPSRPARRRALDDGLARDRLDEMLEGAEGEPERAVVDDRVDEHRDRRAWLGAPSGRAGSPSRRRRGMTTSRMMASGRLARAAISSARAVRRLEHGHAVGLELEAQQPAGALVVVDDEDAGVRRGASSRRGGAAPA